MKTSLFAAVSCFCALSMSAAAQSVHHRIDRDGASVASAMSTEPGQGAFAAISEIAGLLRSDPETDWSRVDIASLRDHLVDMSNLVLLTQTIEAAIPGGLEVRVDKENRVNAAALRMIRAHAPVLEAEYGWSSRVREDSERLIWTVVSNRDIQIIRALGFFGLMATGDHHREHHLAIARGKMAH